MDTVINVGILTLACIETVLRYALSEWRSCFLAKFITTSSCVITVNFVQPVLIYDHMNRSAKPPLPDYIYLLFKETLDSLTYILQS